MAKSKPMELTQPGDTRYMRNTIACCSASGLPVRRVSPYQIKVGPWNCWPDKGTFNRDDMPARQQGLDEFLAALSKWWAAEREIFQREL